MKILITGSFALLTLILGSCKKNPPANDRGPDMERTVRFQLYTNQDFSGESTVIKFSVFIRDAHTTLFDSSLAAMQIKDIPDAAHKLTIEKTVVTNVNADLSAGFHYEIESVGHSGYADTIKAGNVSKVIDYAFQ